jgi:Tol biopolymer transport system component
MFARAALAAALAALVLPSLASATLPGPNGPLAFVSTRSGTPEIWSADASGGNQVQLTTTVNGMSQWPSWSPDHSRIAYATTTYGYGGRWALSVMNTDGTGAHKLFSYPNGQDFDDGPSAWSPDGQWILFSSTRPWNASWGLWEVRPDGTGLHAVTQGWGHAPAWSPDGTKIAYEGTDPVAGNVIVVANADGSGARRLTTGTQPETAPSWSPDGTQIVYGRYTSDYRVSSAHAIFVSNADGTNERQLTFGGSYDDDPAWSPDGRRIVFGRDAELFEIDPDGSNLTPLPMPGTNYSADWAVATAPAPPPPPPDTTAPQIAIDLPADGSPWGLNALVAASYRCWDERDGSGLASCTSNQTGDALDTRAVGWHDFTVTARDNAGNTATKTNRYDVVWPFSGFSSTLTNANAGESVPLRFSLGGPRGLDVLSGVRWELVSCETLATLGPADSDTVSLSYNASLDRYTVQASTERSWDGSCRRAVVTLRDGSDHAAAFRFTK